MEHIKIENILNLEQTIAKDIFKNCDYIWEILPKISDFIIQLGKTLDKAQFDKSGENVWVAKSAKIAPTSCIIGPCIIDENAELRHCSYIRGNVIIGKNAVVRKFNRIEKCNFI